MTQSDMNLSNKQRKNLLRAFLINYGIYLMMQLFFYPTYESQLDLMMRAAVQGASGTGTGYILYSNVIIGQILCGLSTYIPFANWYFMMLSAFSIVALTAISYVVLKRTPNKIGVTVIVVLASFLGYECYVLPGHMKTAAVLAIAAVTVAADEMEQKFAGEVKKCVLTVILASLGSMLSFSVFCLTSLLTISAIIISYVTLCDKPAKEMFAEWKSTLISYKKNVLQFSLLIILPVLLLRGVDCLSYYISGQTDALNYRGAVERMYGYGMGDYQEEYEAEYGISQATYDAMKKGSFTIAGEDDWKMIKMLSKERNDVSGKTIDAFFKTVPLAMFRYGIFYSFIALLFVFSFAPVRQKERFICGEIILLVVVLAIAYIFNAWKNNWIMFVCITSSVVPVLLHMKGAAERECRYLWAYLIVFSVVLYSKFYGSIVSSVATERMSEQFENLSTNEIHVLDINAYFDKFNAKRICLRGILSGENIVTSNGAYGLLDGYENCVLVGQPSDGKTYSWLYNSQEIEMGVLLGN